MRGSIMTNTDFNPTDVEGLAAWFARAEANAAGLRRRLDGLGRDWRDPASDPVRQESKFDPTVRRTDGTATTEPPREKPLYESEIGAVDP
jgi:hypothetical protein